MGLGGAGTQQQQQKTPNNSHGVLIAIFNTSCMEVCLEVASFLDKMLFTELGFLHRQEQVVGQTEKDKSKGRKKYHPPQGGKGGMCPKTREVLGADWDGKQASCCLIDKVLKNRSCYLLF